MIKLSKEQKIESTKKYIRGLMAAEWKLDEAILSAKLLWNLGKRDMSRIAEEMKKEFAPDNK